MALKISTLSRSLKHFAGDVNLGASFSQSFSARWNNHSQLNFTLFRYYSSANMQARKIVIAKKFDGAPKPSDFSIVEETLPAVQDGEILCKAEWLTVDPYMRAASDRLKVGDQMMGGQVARVLKSRCADFPEGSQVVGNFGWRDLTVYKVPPKETHGPATIHVMPEMKGLSDSYALGCMGMPGNTAYFGLKAVCKPKAGNTLVVSAAAGAVGSLVGQMGKIYGCNVIGYAGSDDKVKWLKSLGFDHAHNYKTQKLSTTLKETATKGVDCYFDNVGGEFTFHVMRAMNPLGRIALCGAISMYNAPHPNMIPMDYMSMIYNNLTMEGFVVYRWQKEWFEGINQIREWILQGKLKVEETKYSGFESMPQAFIDLLAGKNTGKVVISA